LATTVALVNAPIFAVRLLVGAVRPTQFVPVENCVPVFLQKIVVWARTETRLIARAEMASRTHGKPRQNPKRRCRWPARFVAGRGHRLCTDEWFLPLLR
jgi:hypothetical protein